MSSNKHNKGYTNTHGSHQDTKGADIGEGNMNMPKHQGSTMSNENYDRMNQGNVTTGSAE